MDTRKKILVAIPTLTAGGAERVFSTLLNHFDRNRFSLTLVVVTLKNAAFAKNLPDDVELINLDRQHVRECLPAILRLIWRIRPIAVLSTLDHMNIGLSMLKPLFPPGVILLVRPTAHPAAVSTLFKKLSFFMALADVIILQSDATQKNFHDVLKWRRRNTVVINNPVDTALIRRAADATDVRPDYPRGKFNLVTVGRLEYVKGMDILVNAVALLNEPDVHVTIVGEGSQRESLKALVKSQNLEKVIAFAGFQENPYPYIAKADGYVLSSRSEGFPNVVLESLALGTPVVSPPLPSVLGIVRDIPECELGARIDAEALAEAMRSFIARGRKRIPADSADRYAAPSITRRYEAVLTGEVVPAAL